MNMKYCQINVRNGKRKKTTQNIKSGKLVATVRSTMLDMPIVYDESQITFSPKESRETIKSR
jgi:hypothetical protein